MSVRLAEWMAIAFFAALVAIVFQQVATSMTEQGIASGGPYNNAASYPRGIAIFASCLLVLQAARLLSRRPALDKALSPPSRSALVRAGGLLLVFALYLLALGWLGYHLATPAMAAASMWLCGARNVVSVPATAVGMSFTLAFVFERLLNVVLPSGIFHLSIPW